MKIFYFNAITQYQFGEHIVLSEILTLVTIDLAHYKNIVFMENSMNLNNTYTCQKQKSPKQVVKYLIWGLGCIGITSTLNVNAAECTTVATLSRVYLGEVLAACGCGPDNPSISNSISVVIYGEGSGAFKGASSAVSISHGSFITLGSSTQTLVYENTASTKNPKQQYSCVWNGSKFTSATFINNPTEPEPDYAANLSHGIIPLESVNIPTTLNTIEKAVDIFDFKIDDTKSNDGLPIKITGITLETSGTGDFNKISWRLNGPDAIDIEGIYSIAANTLTFNGLNLIINDKADETYTISGYFSSSADTLDNSTFLLSITGNTGLMVAENSTQFTSLTPVTNGDGTKATVIATQLLYDTVPTKSISGNPLVPWPIIKAIDIYGNTDIDYTQTIDLSKNGAGTLSGINSQVATAGVANFSELIYTATTDGEDFTLRASSNNLIGITSSTITSSYILKTQPQILLQIWPSIVNHISKTNKP